MYSIIDVPISSHAKSSSDTTSRSTNKANGEASEALMITSTSLPAYRFENIGLPEAWSEPRQLYKLILWLFHKS